MNSAEHILSTLLRQYRAGADVDAACRSLSGHPDDPSLLALSETLSGYGIANGAFRLPFSQLCELPTPFVAYVTSNNGEYVLVTEIDQRDAIITNRNCYQVPMLLNSFEQIYAGTVLVLEIQDNVESTEFASEKQNAPLPDDLPFAVTYIDIGASYGLPVKWERFTADENFSLVLVEPDQAQAAEIALRYPRAQILQVGLGDKNEHADIHVTASQSCSSVLEPNLDTLRRFQLEKWFTVTGKVETELRRYDEISADRGLPSPDFIKIDVQGFEYQVLTGFGELLNDVLCIELETHLLELYRGQKLFSEVHAYLYSRGFYLRHLEQTGNFNTEAVEFNAYFVRQDHLLDAPGKAKVRLWEHVNHMPAARPPRP